MTTGPPPPGTATLAELYDDPALLRGLAGRVAATVGGCEDRVALSTLQLGLTARLLGVAIGCAVDGVVPALDPTVVRWSDDRGSVRLHLDRPVAASGEGTAASVVREVVDRNAEPLVTAVRREVPLALGLLWGNVASAVHGVARVLADGRSAGLAAEVLLDGRLLDGGAVRDGRWRRRTCCLFYRVPGAGVCGDCVFDTAPAL